jgi:hypothetical protein
MFTIYQTRAGVTAVIRCIGHSKEPEFSGVGVGEPYDLDYTGLLNAVSQRGTTTDHLL